MVRRRLLAICFAKYPLFELTMLRYLRLAVALVMAQLAHGQDVGEQVSVYIPYDSGPGKIFHKMNVGAVSFTERKCNISRYAKSGNAVFAMMGRVPGCMVVGETTSYFITEQGTADALENEFFTVAKFISGDLIELVFPYDYESAKKQFLKRKADGVNRIISGQLPPRDAPAGRPSMPAEIKSKVSSTDALNSRCRGGSGDDKATLEACRKRDALVSELQASGWCYQTESPNTPTSEARWMRCKR